MILLHRKTHRVAEFVKSLLKTNFKVYLESNLHKFDFMTTSVPPEICWRTLEGMKINLVDFLLYDPRSGSHAIKDAILEIIYLAGNLGALLIFFGQNLIFSKDLSKKIG